MLRRTAEKKRESIKQAERREARRGLPSSGRSRTSATVLWCDRDERCAAAAAAAAAEANATALEEEEEPAAWRWPDETKAAAPPAVCPTRLRRGERPEPAPGGAARRSCCCCRLLCGDTVDFCEFGGRGPPPGVEGTSSERASEIPPDPSFCISSISAMPSSGASCRSCAASAADMAIPAAEEGGGGRSG